MQLIAIGLAAVFMAALAGGLLHTYNKGVKSEAQLQSVKTALDGCEPLVDCVKTLKTNYATLGAQVNKQNAAIGDLTKQRDAAQDAAVAALKVAAATAAANKPERDRLAALERTFKASGPCPAGQAVTEVRKGLRP